jgi:uncharacterized protein (DUF2252 family)
MGWDSRTRDARNQKTRLTHDSPVTEFVRVGLSVVVSGRALQEPTEQAAKLVRQIIIRYRKGVVRQSSEPTGVAALRHEGLRFCKPRGRVNRRAGGVDGRRQLLPIGQGA